MKSLFVFLGFFSILFAMSNQELALKIEHQMHGFKDATAQMEMVLINSEGARRTRTLEIKILEKEGGNKSLMVFLTPRDVRGTKFLSYEHNDKDDDQWLYIPALKRVKRIVSRNKSGSFMASEFSYEDISAFNAAKYRYQGDVQAVSLEGKKVLKFLRTPKLKSSAYSKIVSYVEPKRFLIVKSDYYDKKGRLFKVATFSDYKKRSGIWRVGRIEMKNVQKSKATILIWHNEQLKAGLSDRDFHKRVLRQ